MTRPAARTPALPADLPTVPAHLGAANPTFLADMLAGGCPPERTERELFVNGLEACADTRTGRPGRQPRARVVLGFTTVDGVRKARVVDTGVGMDPATMVDVLLKLGASGKEQSAEGNFGVGGKITALVRNPHGVRYRSWRDGQGWELTLCRLSDGQYGPRLDPLGRALLPVPVTDKPVDIVDHGTEVVLLGTSAEHDTSRAPGELTDTVWWQARVITDRFAVLPEWAEVFYGVPEADGHERRRRIFGAHHYLNAAAESHGTVRLSDATAHWWLLRDGAGRANPDPVTLSGYVAQLYETHRADHHAKQVRSGPLYSELYSRLDGQAGAAALTSFGIAYGSNRVVLHIAPHDRLPDIGRSRLLAPGSDAPAPLGRWAEEFRAAMPAELAAYVEDLAAARRTDNRQAILDKLTALGGLVSLDNLTRVAGGPLAARRAPKKAKKAARAAKRTRRAAKTTPPRGRERALPTGRTTPPPAGPSPDLVPQMVWLTAEEARAAIGDAAARYDRATHTLQINEGFCVFSDLEALMLAEIGDGPGVRSTLTDRLRRYAESDLTVVVLRVLTHAASAGWTEEQVAAALGTEALTAACFNSAHWLTELRKTMTRSFRSVTLAAAA